MNRGPSLLGGPFRLPGTGASRSTNNKDPHRPGCLCCIGPPDHAFELACAAVKALGVEGVGGPEAEKFVRLCCTAGGGDAVPLSKTKAKAASRSLRPKALSLPPIEPETLERMQLAVLEVYRKPIIVTTNSDTTTATTSAVSDSSPQPPAAAADDTTATTATPAQ